MIPRNLTLHIKGGVQSRFFGAEGQKIGGWEMKKVNTMVVVVFAIVLSLVANVNAGESKIGFGYQAMILEEEGLENILQGVSVRGWIEEIGWEGNIFRNSYDEEHGYEADLWLLTGKAMFATVVHENSKFYVGFELGFGELDVDNDVDEDYDVLIFGPLFGAEYNLHGLPELGFHWEVGYKFANFDNDIEVDIDGVQIALGVHYYF